MSESNSALISKSGFALPVGLALFGLAIFLHQLYFAGRAHATPPAITPGNLVVYRVGDGSNALTGAAAPVFLDEYMTNGTLVQTIVMPTTVNGSNRRLTATGNSTTEGLMTWSADGNYLIVGGYDAPVGTALPGSAATINRVVARVDSNGAINTTTALNDPSANLRGAASTNGTDLWISCSSNGGRYATLGTVGSSTQLSTTVTNLRAMAIFNNQLYVSSASGAFQGVATVGSGTPTTSGQTITLLPGFPTSTGPSSQAFAFLNATTLYVADDRATATGGGLQKWTLSGGTWGLTKTFTDGLTAGLRGLTLSVNGSGQAVLWATTANSPSQLVTVTDTNSVGDSFFTIATAAANTAFRGVALAPVGSTNPSGVGAANPSSVAPNQATLLTVTVTPGTNPPSVMHTVAADLTAIGGSSNQALLDNGSNGDITPNDNVFSFSATVANGTSGGNKSLAFTITETSPHSRTGSGSIPLTVVASTPPAGTGSANPNPVLPGGSSLLTVNVTPGANPPSTGLAVFADLSSIGGLASQAFSGSGNIFTFTATVALGTTPGTKTLPFTITDAQSRSGSGSISLTIQTPPTLDHVVISQLFGGGGNASAPYQNDYIELFNPTSASVTLNGWSLQYASAAGSSWANKQPLGGTIGPSEYFLVSLASGANGLPLPVTPNVSGSINLSATTGKVALVNNGTQLAGDCPLGIDPDIVDFVGYGAGATCREGAANAPAPGNATALFRQNNGNTDTDQNGSDFITGTPTPRRTAPVVELGPWVADTEPLTDGTNAPRDSSLSIDFSEPVDVVGAWYDITCVNTGSHNMATVAHTRDFKTYAITPNSNFQFGEQCTVTVDKNGVHDQDLDDSAPDTDTLFANYVWTFRVVSAGSPAPYPASVHLTMGNPSNATPFVTIPNNYLMQKAAYALSYNRDKGTPNWVSWHLENSWYGTLSRVDTFRPDPAIDPAWYRVQAFDYLFSGFDRGHMTPNADRDHQDRIPINQETYLMSNMVPQAPDNNRGPWADLESYLRTLTDSGSEMYIVSGPAGVGGIGSNLPPTTTNTLANGNVTVPAQTWKVALVIPGDSGDDISRVSCSTRTIAVLMPNTQGILNDPWQNYRTTVDAIEQLTGYDFFSNLPNAVENCVEAGFDGANPPGTDNQSATTLKNTPVTITLQAVRSNNNPLAFSVERGAMHGSLGSVSSASCTGGDCTATISYTPGLDYCGLDSFTFKASDGSISSTISTVTITVNDTLFDNGEWIIATHEASIPETPFEVRINGNPVCTTKLLTFANRVSDTSRFPQVFVIYSSGYIRMKAGADPDPSLRFGQSLVLGPAIFGTSASFPATKLFFHPQLQRVDIATSRLQTDGTGTLVISVTANDSGLDPTSDATNQIMNQTWGITLHEPTNDETRIDVAGTFTFTETATPDATRTVEFQSFRLVQISSMYIDNDHHDVDAFRFRNSAGLATFSYNPGFANTLLPPTPSALDPSNAILDSLHTDDLGQPNGNTPSFRILMETTTGPMSGPITPRAVFDGSQDFNHDNLGLWLHQQPLNVIPQGTIGSISYTVVATTDPIPGDTVVKLSEANYSVGEGDSSVIVTVNRSGDTSGVSTVDFATSNGSASQLRDYEVANGTLTFAAGQTSRTFRVLIVDDVFAEASETVNLTLSNPTGGALGAPSAATITIIDNDSSGASSPVSKQFVANLTGANEVPATPNAVKGNGGIVQLSNDELSARVSLLFTGLTGSETGAHLHGAAPGVNGPMIFSLPLGNPLKNIVINPTPQHVADLRAGQQYLNVHSIGFPNGEIRGQLQWNPVEEADFFVRQAYFDFLSRVPDPGGFAYWTSEVTNCQTDVECLRRKRVDVSNAFFYEQEFQQTAAYVLRLYRGAYGNNQPFPNPSRDGGFPNEEKKLPSFAVFVADRARVIGAANLAQSQADLANLFVTRPEFVAKYPPGLATADQFVDAVLLTLQTDLGVNLNGQRANLINIYNTQGGRGAVMYRLADDNATNPIANQPFIDEEYNRSFVLGQYFGYLRRDPDIPGFIFWLGQVNVAPLRDVPKQHAMVCSFITSGEFQLRFGAVASRNNTECPQ